MNIVAIVMMAKYYSRRILAGRLAGCSLVARWIDVGLIEIPE